MNTLKKLSNQLDQYQNSDLWYQLEDLGEMLIEAHQNRHPVDPDIYKILVQYLENPDSNISETTSRILKQVPDINIAKILIPKINDDSIGLRNLVVDILKSIGEEKEILNEIRSQLAVKNDDVVIFTLDIMKEISDSTCISDLKKLIQHENLNIKIRAIECLGFIDDTQAKKILCDIILDGSPDESVLAGALLALGRAGDRKYVDAILKCPETSQAISAYKCRSLGELASEECGKYLIEMISSNEISGFVKRKALEGLANLVRKNGSIPINIDTIVKNINEFLNSGNKELVKSSVAIIGRLKINGYLEMLGPYFNAKSSEIRLHTLQSIEDDYSPKASHIRRLMEHDINPDIRLLALNGRIREQGRKKDT